MLFFMSGTPRNDKYQLFENTLCTCRLFSLHGDYQRAVMKWLEMLKEGIRTYPERLADYEMRKAAGRLDVGERPPCGDKYPRTIMLDSGAFTAWNAGGEALLPHVMESYHTFIDAAIDDNGKPLFDDIWMINLDKIPGKKGVDPTPEEIVEAIRISDENYAILKAEFGDRILPVFHQGEDEARLREVAEMTHYICVSPRNDLPERQRKQWSDECHRFLEREFGTDEFGKSVVKTHGLATTGNNMIRDVPWHSIDSAAWVLHAAYGMVDIFEPDMKPHPIAGSALPGRGSRYRNYFISYDSDKHKRDDKHLDNQPPLKQNMIWDVIASYGFDTSDRANQGKPREQWVLKGVRTDTRVRNLICMGELERYAAWAREHQKLTVPMRTVQGTLFGIG